MATTTVFSIESYWKINKTFFLETTNMIEPILHEWSLDGSRGRCDRMIVGFTTTYQFLSPLKL